MGFIPKKIVKQAGNKGRSREQAAESMKDAHPKLVIATARLVEFVQLDGFQFVLTSLDLEFALLVIVQSRKQFFDLVQRVPVLVQLSNADTNGLTKGNDLMD